MDEFVFNQVPVFEIGSNKFIEVPSILQYENTPLIRMTKDLQAGFATETAIYHADGTYLAKVVGARLFSTPDGEQAGVKLRHEQGLVVCELQARTAFELRHVGAAAVRGRAELFTPDGAFLAVDRTVGGHVKVAENQLAVGGMTFTGCTFQKLSIGIWVKKDGSVAVGVA